MKAKPLLFVLIFLFVTLSLLAKYSPYFGGDINISRSLQNIDNPLFRALMISISRPGDGLGMEIIIGSSLLSLLFVGLKTEALMTFLFTSGSAVTGSLLKNIVDRPRPDISLVQTYQSLADRSFPSFHVLIYTTFFGYMFYLAMTKVKTGWLKYTIALGSLFLVLTIGISRIYLGAHWASDILGGYLLGAIFLIIIIKLNQKLID